MRKKWFIGYMSAPIAVKVRQGKLFVLDLDQTPKAECTFANGERPIGKIAGSQRFASSTGRSLMEGSMTARQGASGAPKWRSEMARLGTLLPFPRDLFDGGFCLELTICFVPTGTILAETGRATDGKLCR
jgi:hypothetical protein